MKRKSILRSNLEMFVVYSNQYYIDVTHPQIFETAEELAEALQITLKSLRERISKKMLYIDKEVYKYTLDGKEIRLC